MCTLALYYRVFSDYPIVVAANRDEQRVTRKEPVVQRQRAHITDLQNRKVLCNGGGVSTLFSLCVYATLEFV